MTTTNSTYAFSGDRLDEPIKGGCKGAQFTLIANVPYDTVRQDLVVEFRKFGRVELAMVVCDEASRHPHKEWTSTAGYAFVRFSKRSEAAAAIQAASLGLITIRGTRVRADWARKDSYAKRGRVELSSLMMMQEAEEVDTPTTTSTSPIFSTEVDNTLLAFTKAFSDVWTASGGGSFETASEEDTCRDFSSFDTANKLCCQQLATPGMKKLTLLSPISPVADSVLSPNSRGLLAEALKDVASGAEGGSPEAHKLDPEELLRRAMAGFTGDETPVHDHHQTASFDTDVGSDNS